jgi:type I restriction enzyme R subunit
VALVRRVSGIDGALIAYDRTVDRNFKKWIFERHAGSGSKFSEEQMAWLRMIKDQVASNIHLEFEDLDYTPFDAQGGRGRLWQLFGTGTESLIAELNEALAG